MFGLAWAVAGSLNAAELMITEGTNLGFDLDRRTGEVVFDLYGHLWTLPAGGGNATMIAPAVPPLSRPRLSPSGENIVAENASNVPTTIFQFNRLEGTATILAAGPWSNRMPAWHPDGRRIAFSSDRAGTWDIWELDLESESVRPLSFSPGDESYPQYSSSGDEVAWIEDDADGSHLAIVGADRRAMRVYHSRWTLHAPSFRPDATVVTFVEARADGSHLRGVIRSGQPVTKTLLQGQDFFPQPLVWIDRQQALYAADGKLRQLEFGERQTGELPWTAWVSVRERKTRSIRPETNGVYNRGRYVLRIGRLFDGIHAEYRRGIDVLVVDDRIRAVSAAQSWDDSTPVLDYSSMAAYPGLIDAAPAAESTPQAGLQMLASGVTAYAVREGGAVNNEGQSARVNALPAPVPIDISHIVDLRSLDDGQQRRELLDAAIGNEAPVITDRLFPDIANGATLFGGASALPVSLMGFSYNDVSALLKAAGTTLIISAAATPLPPWESRRLRESRQNRLLGDDVEMPLAAAPGSRRTPARFSRFGQPFIVGSAGSALPPGLDLHASIAVLAAEGVPGFRILQAATLDAALALGVGGDLGSIEAGKYADLVVVDGDPLGRTESMLDIVAVIRRGEFLSVEGLAASVE